MISFKRKNGAKGILRQDKSHKKLIDLCPKSYHKNVEALSLSALSHTHTQFSDFPGESVYTKSFAIAN